MHGRRICFVSSEVAPFAKTGGLADVSGSLPKYVAGAGCDIRVFMPFYSSINTSRGEFHVVEFLRDIPLRFGDDWLTFNVVTTRLPNSAVDVYFIDCPSLYGRGRIYTDDHDEYLRFALLSRAAIECCQRMGWSPDVFHCNDWQTALIPLYLRAMYGWDRLFDATRTILTIHNIAYQGIFSSGIIHHLGLDSHAEMFGIDDLRAGIVNFLKTGIFYADVLTTVSRTYAHEIQTPEFGAGLEEYLRRRSDALFGIVNGVDYNEWSPERDTLIPCNFTIDDLSGKEEDKRILMRRLELDFDENAPLLGIVSRLTAQKGFDLFFDIMDAMLARHNFRLAVLGSGEDKYEGFFASLHERYRGRVCFYRGFQNELAHLIEAGSDIFLMPSQFEPCGLNQIYSLAYGTIPVVRKTGGLADTVQGFDPATGEGTGFVFDHFTPEGLAWGMESAITAWHDRRSWRQIIRNAMSRNYSWEVQVREYLRLYGEGSEGMRA
jgi:starch synthase